MNRQYTETLPDLFTGALAHHGERIAIGMIGGEVLTYDQLNQRIRSLMALMEQAAIGKGDRIAILSNNQPNWGAVYLAATFMGAVAVPLLPDFHEDEIANIVKHSEPALLFVSEGLAYKLKGIKDGCVRTVIRIEDFQCIAGEPFRYDSESEPKKQYHISSSDLALIIYTSGTSGKSKGVMLSHENICFTARQSGRVQEITWNDRFLSVLPLSHTYENTIGFVLPLMKGASIHYLGKPPTPAILLPALQEVKPTVMLTVPLIIEKIYRNKIRPALYGKPVIRTIMQIPFMRRTLHRAAGKKLLRTFGGELKFFGIGGAKLNRTVEQFLIEARFPYAIGYGLTETSPLLAGFNPAHARLQSTGPSIEDIELIIHNPDPLTGEGEIWARGPNVMKGYYKEPDLTREILTADGWLRTGDLGVFDQDRYLYIKGRLKNVIVRPGGENIYPEEIESVINNFIHVVDSLVIEKKGKLVALVHFNMEEIEAKFSHLGSEIREYAAQRIEELRVELKHYVNHRVNKFSQLQLVVIQPEPFEKTATQKIKRFLYG